MNLIKKVIYSLFFLLALFFHIYPAAMPLFGYSFVFTGGLLGLGLYMYNKFPYVEMVKFFMCYGAMVVWAYICTFVMGAYDNYIITYSKSTLGWFFSAYFIIYLFFKIYPRKGVDTLIYFIIAAIVLQGIISVAMYLNPNVADFFNSIQIGSDDLLLSTKRAQTEGKRLLGFGIAFFGAGVIYGVALIFLIYILMAKKLNLLQVLFFSILYIFVFFVGMLSARTTLVGGFASLGLLIILLFRGNSGRRSQLITFIFYSVILVTISITLIYQFFFDMADWALEPFINYKASGELRTDSSDGLVIMFMLPQTFVQWIFGIGVGNFWGSDVGFTRLLYWFGLPGTILFFLFGYLLIKQSFTANQALNYTLLVTFAYNLALNVKGLSDLNWLWALFAFYFLYYNYYIYTPYLYRIGRIKQNTLRTAVQG